MLKMLKPSGEMYHAPSLSKQPDIQYVSYHAAQELMEKLNLVNSNPSEATWCNFTNVGLEQGNTN